VHTDALATRIVLEGGRAVGVEVLRNNVLETVRAEREVIVCAGAYHSPHLLLLSGIGPADELRALRIEPRVDLPVGKNLQDHPFVAIVWLTEQSSLGTAMTPENLALFEREGRGPLTSGFCDGGAFIRTRPDLVAPDIQFHFGGGASVREATDPLIPHDGFTIFPTLLAPTSRGQVTLRSALAHAKPRILHNYTPPSTTGAPSSTAPASRWRSPRGRRCATCAQRTGLCPNPTRTPTSWPSRATTPARSSIPWGRAQWGRWSMPNCVSTASSVCGSSMPR
jgi:choline dehydrogenase-like flavoprotein